MDVERIDLPELAQDQIERLQSIFTAACVFDPKAVIRGFNPALVSADTETPDGL